MKLIKKTLKLLIFGLVLIFLSVGYRLLGDRNNNDTEGKNLINNAKADVPQPGGGGGGACEGTGPSEGGSDGGSSGDGGGSGGSSK